jgi:hypothetical protein
VSWEAQQWAYEQAPMLLTAAGKPDTTARAVLAAVAYHAGPDGRDSYAGPSRLVFETGFDERTVRRVLDRLEAAKLIVNGGRSQYGTTRWHVDMTRQRPAEDWEAVLAAQSGDRAAVAERVRAHRARKAAVTHAESVTAGAGQADVTDSASQVTDSPSRVTHSESVTPTHVTDSASAVTDSASVCNALSAPQSLQEPPKEPPTTTSGEPDDAVGVLLHLLPQPGKAPAKTTKTASSNAADFEAFWNAYPKRNGQRVGKKNAAREYDKTLKKATAPQLLAAVARYAKTCNGFPKDAERFLRDEIWADLDTTQPDRAAVNGPIFEGPR